MHFQKLRLWSRYHLFLSIFFCCALLTSCSIGNSNELTGVVNLWHSWDDEEAAVLNQVLDRFTDIHPDVTVRATVVESEELRGRFEQSVAAGLGPDLLLGPSSWIMPLADAGLIQQVGPLLSPDVWDRYLPTAVETVNYQNEIYGIPESLQLAGLYYNKELIEEPALTLEALIQEADQGRRIGMSPAFMDAFWGIQAFGGELFDEDERVILDNGGLANWLAWLKTTLDIPNIVLDKDSQTLTALFAEGELAYLVAGSRLRKDLEEQLGEAVLGVAPLPSGPINAAGPFLNTDSFMLSIASSPRQVEAAVSLATFITNAEQQTLLMRRAGSIPTNTRVRNNPSIDQVAYAFRTQARNAVPFRNSPNMEAVVRLGDDAFNRSLQGVAEPNVTAQELTSEINIANGFTVEEVVVDRCTGAGSLSIWLGEGLPESGALSNITELFIQDCPAIEVELTVFPPEEMSERLLSTGIRSRPDLMLIPNQWVTALVLSDVLQPLGRFIEPDELQTYHPVGLETLRSNGQLYGIPFVLMPQALYMNQALASESVQALSDIIPQGQEGKQLGLSLSFVEAYWGVSAHGGNLFAEDGRLILDDGGMTAWLTWLEAAKANSALVTDLDMMDLRARFATGELAYLVDRPEALANVEEALGDDLQVIRLPSGPVADAEPLLLTAGLAVRQDISTEQTELAMEFIDYATNQESQTAIAETERLLPAIIGVALEPADPLSVFAEQAGSSTVYPNRIEMVAVEELGRRFYTNILEENQIENGSSPDVDTTVRDIVADINKANGFEPEAEPDEDGEEESESD